MTFTPTPPTPSPAVKICPCCGRRGLAVRATMPSGAIIEVDPGRILYLLPPTTENKARGAACEIRMLDDVCIAVTEQPYEIQAQIQADRARIPPYHRGWRCRPRRAGNPSGSPTDASPRTAQAQIEAAGVGAGVGGVLDRDVVRTITLNEAIGHCGVEQRPARVAHTHEVAGSSPASAIGQPRSLAPILEDLEPCDENGRRLAMSPTRIANAIHNAIVRACPTHPKSTHPPRRADS